MRRKKFELAPGESIVRIERRAKWYPSKIDVAEGVLVLTDRRLAFVPYGGMAFLSPIFGSAVDAAAAGGTGIPKAKPRVELPRPSIRAIEATKRRRVSVTDVKGKVYRFEVMQPAEWESQSASRPLTIRFSPAMNGQDTTR